MDLFEHGSQQNIDHLPLAERMRPKTLEEFVGQNRVMGSKSLIRRYLNSNHRLPNLVFWGPPGTGKTTLAYLIAAQVEGEFVSVNAIDTGAKRLRELGEQAKERRLQFQRDTVLFIDEIHRLNKSQQDVLLPFTERGHFILIGATTENPGYELNSALLSRSQVLTFEAHTAETLTQILQQACDQLNKKLDEILEPEAIEKLLQFADGDARQLLNLFDQVLQSLNGMTERMGAELLEEVVETSPFYFDKTGDQHYNTISAFIKSIRGSDPNAAVYYLARMLEGGEDPKFIARRLVILASEDIGNADPRGLSVAVAGLQAVEFVGLPEAAINLAQVTTYLASAPKSNRSYQSLLKAKSLVKTHGQLPVPNHLKSDKTKISKQLGHGVDYKYSHEGATGWLDQQYLPDAIKEEKLYEPAERGFEKNITQYLNWVKGVKS